MRAAGYALGAAATLGALQYHGYHAVKAETMKCRKGILKTTLMSTEHKYRPQWFFDMLNFNPIFPGVESLNSDPLYVNASTSFKVEYVENAYVERVNSFKVTRLGNPDMRTETVHNNGFMVDVVTTIPEDTTVYHDKKYRVIATSPAEFRKQARRMHGVNYPLLAVTVAGCAYYTVKFIKIVA